MLTDMMPTLSPDVATTDPDLKMRNLDWAGQIAAIDKSQAVIEFDLDGTIRRANQNFLATVGYTLAEIKGRHHGIFVDDAYRNSSEYRQFWQRLNAGEYVSGEFKRIGPRRPRGVDPGVLQPDPGRDRSADQGRQVRQRHYRG